MKISENFKTSFSSDEEAKMYAAAAVDAIRFGFENLRGESSSLILDWCIQAETGNDIETAARRLTYLAATVAPANILVGVVHHFGLVDGDRK